MKLCPRGVVAVVSVLLASCGLEDAALEEDVGVLQLELREVPPGVNCIRVIATGPRTVQRDFQPTYPGQTSIFRMDRLPLGRLAFSAEAYGPSCSALPSGSVPIWVGGPVEVDMVESFINTLTIVMQRNGRAQVDVDFDDPQCRAPGAACVDDSYCCGAPNMVSTCQSSVCQQACQAGFADCNQDPRKDGCEIDVRTDVANCGGCGNVCRLLCSGGVCLNSSLAAGGTVVYGLRMLTSPQADVTAELADGARCLTVDPSWAGKIVLCERGDDFFLAKARNVQAAGGVAVVVYNDVPGSISLGIPSDEIAEFPIPIGFYPQASGQFFVVNRVGQTATFLSR